MRGENPSPPPSNLEVQAAPRTQVENTENKVVHRQVKAEHCGGLDLAPAESTASISPNSVSSGVPLTAWHCPWQMHLNHRQWQTLQTRAFFPSNSQVWNIYQHTTCWAAQPNKIIFQKSKKRKRIWTKPYQTGLGYGKHLQFELTSAELPNY